ncbi:MAG: cupin domain-containing protein [Desulfomonilaceae bacterium]
MEVKRFVEDVSWTPHPVVAGVQVKPLVTQREHSAAVTCMLVKIPVGKDVPEHIHADQDDILFPLEGSGVMWVDGTGEFPLTPGMVVRVPKGVRHKIGQVTEELVVYDVFSPYLI